MGNKPAKSKPIEPEELMRQMEQNPDVVVEYYRSRQHLITKFVEENIWEEDLNEWLHAIRKRSPKESLQIRKVDFLREKNTKQNSTSKYKNQALVIRRASFFEVDVYFGDRHFDADRDDVNVHLSLGANPSVVTKTKIVCPVVAKAGEKSQWFCQVLGDDKTAKKLSLRINVPADAIVARYAFSLEIVSGTAEGRVTSEHKNNSVIVLFNPLSEEDTVYMEDERMRNEYVFADKGFVNLGGFWKSVKYCDYKEWNFAQFDRDVLDSVLLLLHNDSRSLQEPEKSYKRRNDPVYVSRVLSAMVNCADDKGVIWGRWDGNYDDGKSPGTWNHSGKMLEEWRNNDMAPVKYGQCWVFSAVLTTVLRAVGIPARSVTNYSSAHDTNRNVTIDYYYDIDAGERIRTSDSVWNFHVWNEAYFDRPDLSEGYGGWQVVDATPQEVSPVEMGRARRRELYQCGPAPVKAIKNGEINIGFDTNFIFGEVNADEVTWNVKDGKIVGQPRINMSAVGICIATKAMGEMETEDITLTYKYKEGTEEERVAFKKAYGRGTRDHAGYFGNEAVIIKPTYEITVKGSENDVLLGSAINTTIQIKNLSEKTSLTSLKISAKSQLHTGVLHKLLKKVTKEFTLEAGKTEEFSFDLSYVEYASGLVDSRVVNILALATDTADGNTVTQELNVTLKLPKCISIDIPTTIPKEKKISFSVALENKLPFPLTSGMIELWLSGADVTDTEFTVDKPIAPGEIYKIEGISLTPDSDSDEFNGTIAFASKEVPDMLYNFERKLE